MGLIKKRKVFKLKTKKQRDAELLQPAMTVEEEVRALEEGIAAEAAEKSGEPGKPAKPVWKQQAAVPEELKKGAKKYAPFAYVNEGNLKRLVICLTREGSPKTIALVVSYLKPEFVRVILNALPQEMQAMVAVEMATIHQMGQDQVRAIDKDIKGKIGFLIGGLDHLLKVLEQVDSATRDNILSSLRTAQPDLYEKVRKFIILFEDIPEFPDQAMQVIVRELKSDSLAKALRNAPPEIMNKFLSNMSTNAATVLKEEMEYGRPLTAEEINEERERIIALVKKMESENKIFIREKPQGMMLDGAEPADEAAAAGQPAQGGQADFQGYFEAGAKSYEQGRYEEAVQYFEYCSQVDPSNAAVFQYLGGAYYALGMKQEAVEAYRKALELDPSNEELKQWLEQNR